MDTSISLEAFEADCELRYAGFQHQSQKQFSRVSPESLLQLLPGANFVLSRGTRDVSGTILVHSQNRGGSISYVAAIMEERPSVLMLRRCGSSEEHYEIEHFEIARFYREKSAELLQGVEQSKDLIREEEFMKQL